MLAILVMSHRITMSLTKKREMKKVLKRSRTKKRKKMKALKRSWIKKMSWTGTLAVPFAIVIFV